MKPLPDKTELFASFSRAGKEEWVNVAFVELGGKNPFETLQWSIGELKGAPYYIKADLEDKAYLESFALPASQDEFSNARKWLNTPIINVLNEHEANKKALNHLVHGADGILFDLRKKSSASIQKLLQDIEWPYCSVAFYLSEHTGSFSEDLDAYVAKNNFNKSALHGFCLSETYPQHPQVLHKIIHSFIGYENFHLLGIHSHFENQVEQVSDLLTKAVAFLNQLEESGMEYERAFKYLFFSTTVSCDFFVEIAKLKALRMLWYQIAQAYGVHHYQPSDLFIHAHNMAWSRSTFEPHENMLKGTTASMAAILGGCHALTTCPADDHDPLPSRIARNVSNVLREESHLNKVADPTAGSYYVDNLVHILAGKAWEKFKHNAVPA